MAEVFKLADGSPARKFASCEEMDEQMIECWNAVVRSQDHVYNLGDFTMIRGAQSKWIASVIKRLNGHKRIVMGNHDQIPAKWYLANGIEKIYGVRVIDRLVCTHIPIAPWCMGRFQANLHGHVHTKFPKVYRMLSDVRRDDQSPDDAHSVKATYVNLSVEAIDYTPVSLEEIKSWL